jgi:mono/diheme cytochrome c family protein
MGGAIRAGTLLLVLAACGGGQRDRGSDTAAMSSGGPTTDTTAMLPDSMLGDSAMSAPANGTTPAVPESTQKKAVTSTGTQDTSKKAGAASQDASKKAAGAQDTSKKAAGAQDTSKKAAAAKPSGGGGITPQQIAQGDSIFHGQLGGGTCTACHGQDAKGTAIAPDLTDSKWINGDGSYQFLVNTITNGVPKPKEHPAPMPPKGGAPLTDDQVKAVAAYEYSLSHKT